MFSHVLVKHDQKQNYDLLEKFENREKDEIQGFFNHIDK